MQTKSYKIKQRQQINNLNKKHVFIFFSIGIIFGLVLSRYFFTEKPLSKIIEQVKPAIVQILLQEKEVCQAIATGVIINKNYAIATSAHIVDYALSQGEGKNVAISVPWDYKGEQRFIIVPCKVVKKDTRVDIAILVPNQNLTKMYQNEGQDIKKYLASVRTRKLKDFKVGEAVVMGGFPMADAFGSFHSFHKGIISKIDTLDTPDMKGVWAIQTDIVSCEGFSGSPLFLARTGEVIGIVWGGITIAKDKVITCATPVDYLAL